MSNLPRGSSAATIIVEDDRVIKLDTAATGTRVREQGLWLHAYPNKHLPQVQRITSRGYEMQRLHEVDVKTFLDDPLPLLGEVWRTYENLTLRSSYPQLAARPFVPLDPEELDRYILNLCLPLGALSTARRLHDLRPAIDWRGNLSWTHGDLILDNVMRDDEGFVVFIDAIPPCPALPSLPVVDYGRLIQSAAGYEQIRYASTIPRPEVSEDRISTVLNWIANSHTRVFDVDAVRGALFYAVIHMLRGARTCRDSDDRRLMIEFAEDVILEELNRWML